MSPARLKTYSKNLGYTYSFGIFPTLELLDSELDRVMCVVIRSRTNIGDGFKKLSEKCSMRSIEICVNDQLIERLSPREGCYAVGVFRKYTQVLDRDSNHIVLVNPSNMGNLGTILRTIVGFGFKDVAIIRPAVDIFIH